MFTFNNTHIFTGYLKQLMASINIPMCKIYTSEFANYFEKHGQEDPRIIESLNTLNENRRAIKINYLKDNDLYTYEWKNLKDDPHWTDSAKIVFEGNEAVHGLTRTFTGTGNIYDTKTHNYLGEFLRFIRDYHNIDLMSLYNCFDNKIYNNVYLRIPQENKKGKVFPGLEVNSNDPNYHIYAIPVKLFANYTIALDCPQPIEVFCGFYGTRLSVSERSIDLIKKTYKKYSKTSFSKPFLYEALDIKYWTKEKDLAIPEGKSIPAFLTDDITTRWDIVRKEQDLKLFIKVPVSCRSSIVVLEGDYRNFNDCKYAPEKIGPNKSVFWNYKQNTFKANFQPNVVVTEDAQSNSEEPEVFKCILPDLNDRPFKPISKLQLLTLNTGESHPFADRLVEYLLGSAITSSDEIADNIKRVQKVLNKNGYFFTIEGLWEPQMQKVIYDYILNTGPIDELKRVVIDNKEKFIPIDKQRGLHPSLGHRNKSSVFDILGYVDKDAEKWYASWEGVPLKVKNEVVPGEFTSAATETIQDVDIYNGLYDID